MVGKFLKSIALLLGRRAPWILVACAITLGSCKTVYYAFRYNKPGLQDYQLWEERKIQRQGEIFEFDRPPVPQLPPIEEWAIGPGYREGISKEEFFQKTGTKAFLFFRNDSLLHEYYDPQFSDATVFNSFSMAKSYISVLVGIAISEGHIQSIHQSVGDYLPQFAKDNLCGVKISHLLQMTSGLKTSNSKASLTVTTTQLYYGDQPLKTLDRLRLPHPPGTKWEYQNANLQILGMVLEAATGMPPAEYLASRIWQYLGAEADASWSLHDNSDLEKNFCCLNARARDFGRFGHVLMHQGQWQGRQLIPADWIKASTKIDTAEGARAWYQYCFYTTAEQEDYYLEGLLGQFTYICPSTSTVVVRIGNKINPGVPWYQMFKRLAGLTEKKEAIDLPMDQLTVYAGKWRFGKSTAGDPVMLNKEVRIKSTRRGLKIKSRFNRNWQALANSPTEFFNEEYARSLQFLPDSLGEMNRLFWERSGNAWYLDRIK